MKTSKNPLIELDALEKAIEKIGDFGRVRQHAVVRVKKHDLPIYSITMGSKKPDAPVFGIFGGIHGLERIGARVALSYLQTISELLEWDQMIHALLKHIRLVFMPVCNPAGMLLQTRANGNHVDLMRNAPVEAALGRSFPLVGGHRLGGFLPWYRGPYGSEMEIEAKAVCECVREEIFPAQVAITLDLHSGFGFRDRIWFPYGKTIRPYPEIGETFAIKELLDKTYPNHMYHFEPQSHVYTVNGDLWDYLYNEYSKKQPKGKFLPLTLEMGSWTWVKKNPLQIFSVQGVFNPIKAHRRQRTLRRHLIFLDFLARAVVSTKKWLSPDLSERRKIRHAALDYWYRGAWKKKND